MTWTPERGILQALTSLRAPIAKQRQVDLLRTAFDCGESLTVAEALSRFGIYALSQRCGDLRREGYPVESVMVELPNGKRVARYSKLAVAYG